MSGTQNVYLSDYLNTRLPLRSNIVTELGFEAADGKPYWMTVARELSKTMPRIDDRMIKQINASYGNSGPNGAEAFINRYGQMRGSTVGVFAQALLETGNLVLVKELCPEILPPKP
jgi:hypothetical protein